MNRLLLIFCCWLTTLLATAQQVIVVKAGDAQSLLEAISEANKRNADIDAEQLFVLIPNGTYDLGTKVLTQVTGHHIAFVGQGMKSTVIKNCPNREDEGISKTGVLQNRGSDNYFQDLTLCNDMDYYTKENDGRAVTLHDKGTRTILNRVCLFSHQDTYYSDNEDCQHYLKDSEIHGTVDFICGTGDVWFEHCKIVTEKRTTTGKGRNVIAAPRTAYTNYGYVFNYCTIENIISDFQYARGWHTQPRCVWLHTTLLTPEKLRASRFDPNAIRGVDIFFGEYDTTDAQGHDITPKSNVITYVCKEEQKEAETILTAEAAKKYTLSSFFGDWHPDKVLKATEKKAKKLIKKAF